MCPGFELKRHLQGQVQLSTWTVRFEVKFDFVAKQIQVGDTTRLVTEEDSICSLCADKGHNSWSCSDEKGVRLSEAVARRKGKAGSPMQEE